MSYLVDTTILIRFANEDDPEHDLITMAVKDLASRGNMLYYSPQGAREAWSVMTRPKAINGYGLTIEEAGIDDGGHR